MPCKYFVSTSLACDTEADIFIIMQQLIPITKYGSKILPIVERGSIKTRGDKIGMTLCSIKPLNDVRRKFSADHYVYW